MSDQTTQPRPASSGPLPNLIPGTSNAKPTSQTPSAPAFGNNAPLDPLRVNAPGAQLDPTSVRPQIDQRNDLARKGVNANDLGDGSNAAAGTYADSALATDTADVPLTESELSPADHEEFGPGAEVRHGDAAGNASPGPVDNTEALAAASVEVSEIRRAVSQVRNRDRAVLALIDGLAAKIAQSDPVWASALRSGTLGLLGSISDNTPNADVVPAAGSRHPDDVLAPANLGG